jgi:superfamily II DNA/RNA helicase
MATHTTEVEAAAAEQTITFAELGLAPEVQAAVRDAGYQHPTPIQAEAIPLVLKGRDVMGLAQTGTGKTAAFTLPMVNQLLGGPRRTRGLVLTPTRELCVQVEESVQKYARHSELNVTSVYGGVPIDPQQRKLRAGVDIVVATPGRLIDHLAMSLEQGRLRLMDVPEQAAELLAYEYELTAGRTLRANAPEGMHDDCVIALALACWGATGNGGTVGGYVDTGWR